MSIWIKICANTSLEDALMAVDAGADAVGFVFAPSPRRVTAAEVAGIAPRLPHAVEKFGVFVDAALEEIVSAVEACGLTGVQLHYDAEPALRILRVIRFRAETAGLHGVQLASHAQDPHVDAVLVDSCAATAAGGTGVAFDWSAARKALFQQGKTPLQAEKECKFIAAGGLNPGNVADAITLLRPWGVDAASGVEAAPGRKDPAKVREFIARARAVEGDRWRR